MHRNQRLRLDRASLQKKILPHRQNGGMQGTRPAELRLRANFSLLGIPDCDAVSTAIATKIMKVDAKSATRGKSSGLARHRSSKKAEQNQGSRNITSNASRKTREPEEDESTHEDAAYEGLLLRASLMLLRRGR